MKKMPMLFKYHAWYENADGTVCWDDTQERFVVAHSEDEADDKMLQHSQELKESGFCGLRFVCMAVEAENLII